MFHLDALRCRILTNLGVVNPAPRRPAPIALAAGIPPARCGARIARQRITQRLGVLGVQVDLILAAV